MPAFTDSQGKVWTVEVTVGLVRRVRTVTAADEGIGRVIDLAEVSGAKFIANLLVDRFAVAVVAWLLCEEQARQDKISEDDFYRRIAAVYDKVTSAIVEAAASFGKSQEERTIFLGLVQSSLNANAALLASEQAKARAVELDAISQTPSQVQQLQTERLQRMREAEQELFEELTSSTNAGGSQPSPGSAAPADTPTASSSDSPSNDSAPNGSSPPSSSSASAAT